MRKIILLTLTGSLLAVMAKGQNNNPIIPDLVSPSPQAAQFIRYGEIPVGYTTGVPQIDIPIYTLSTGWIDIPISISYHASGFRVSDIPSPVGLGWVLNGSGWFIARQVEVRPDFEGYTDMPIISKEQVDSLKIGTKLINYQGSNLVNFSQYGNWAQWDNYFFNSYSFSTPFLDTRSDRYFYSFPGGDNGVVRYNVDTREFTTIPYAPVKMERVSQDFYRIIDSKGIQYEYTQKEISSVMGKGQVTSAWYLTKIIYPGKKNFPIVFSYKTGASYTDSNISKLFSIVDARNFISSCGSLDPSKIPTSELSSLPTTRNSTPYSSPLIEKITWQNVTIAFTYSTDRLDQRKDRLTSVTVSHNNSVIKQATTDNNVYFGNASTNYRLKLKGITLSGSDTNSPAEKYAFNYYYETSAAPNYYLQSGQTICSEDYWGYYNGTSSINNFPNDVDWKSGMGIYANDMAIFQPFRQWSNAVSSGQYSTNRTPNEESMKYFVLKEIVYPTKGKSVLEYEMNKVSDAYQFKSNQEVGGLRLKKRINYSADNAISDTKTYEYEGYATQTIMNNYYGYGTLAIDYYICSDMGGPSHYGNIAYPIYFFGGNSYSSLTDWTGSNVFYTKIKEYIGEKATNNGWTEYNYKEESRQLNGECSFNIDDYLPSMISKINDCDKGYIKSLLTSSISYDKSGDTVKKVENQYDNYFIPSIHTGVRVGQSVIYPSGYQRCLEISFSPQSEYQMSYLNKIYAINTYAFRDVSLLSSTTETDYVNGQPATSKITSYNYDVKDNKPVLFTPSSVTTQNSNGENWMKKTFFPYSDSYKNQSPYNIMTNNNMLEYPIEIKTEKGTNNQLVNQTLTTYKQVSNRILPDVVSTRYLASAPLAPLIQYLNYNTYGNPVYIIKDAADQVVYLWGYNYQYPIAEIAGAAYSDVTAKISESALDTISVKNEPTVTDWTTINNLRTQLPAAQVTTYEYKPLVGMTKMTDPKGVVTQYVYDNFGRLQAVYVDGKQIETYNYHYKNQ